MHRVDLWSTEQELAIEKAARMRAEARCSEEVALRQNANSRFKAEIEAIRLESAKFGKLAKEVENPGRGD